MIIGRYCKIIVPQFRKGLWKYDESPCKVAVSTKSPMSAINGKYLSTLTYLETQLVLNYIHEKGFKEDEVSSNDRLRDQLNLQYYSDVRNKLTDFKTTMYIGVSTTLQLQIVNTIRPKLDILVSYKYCKKKDNKLVSAIGNYKAQI